MISNPAVLHIIAGFSLETPLGGIERFVFSLCEQLRNSDFSIEIFGLWSFGTTFEEDWRDKLENAGINTHIGTKWNPRSPYLSFYNTIQLMRRELRDKRFSIIHSHNQFSDIIAPSFTNLFGSKAVIRTVHNEFEWRYRPFRRLSLTNFYYPIVYSTEIGVSKGITNRLNRRMMAKILKREATYIPNAIDLERFLHAPTEPSKARKLLNIPDANTVIGFVGRMTEQKGFTYGIQAIPHVLSSYPDAIFAFIGSGDLKQELLHEVRELDLQAHVRFLEPITELEKVFPAFDLFVSPSLWEGLPSVVLEAMASRVPVVATDISGTNELVREGRTGWLVPKEDPIALAAAILSALMDPQLRKAFSMNAQKLAEKYSIVRIAQQHENLYQNHLK